jgi:hypothetical protein
MLVYSILQINLIFFDEQLPTMVVDVLLVGGIN